MRVSVLLLFLGVASGAVGQSEFRLLTYNLLRFGYDNTFCNLACKDNAIKTVVDSVRPDIFVVQEMRNAEIYGERILVNILNTGDRSGWQAGDLRERSGSEITQLLFYDSDRFVLHDFDWITTSPRYTQVYTLYPKTTQLAQGDTLFFRVMAVHLKAGDSSSDESDRESAATAIRNFITNNPAPYPSFICGDFNLYTSAEDAFRTLAQEGVAWNFNDPISTFGSWTNNSSFAAVHTQSTRTSSEADDGTPGGCDDRFDFILVSDTIFNGNGPITYLNNSYTAYGNNGNIFNDNIFDSNLPSSVEQALYRASDHLPVYADFTFTGTPAARSEAPKVAFTLAPNPVSGVVEVQLQAVPREGQLRIVDAAGRVVLTQALTERSTKIATENLPAGMYVVHVEAAAHAPSFRRFIKR